MRSGRNRWLSAYSGAVYVFLFLPIVILIIFSFNADKRNFNWAGFTFDWYPTLLNNELIMGAVGVTLQVAFVAVVASVVLGTLLGLGLARIGRRWGGPMEVLLLLPMVTPEIVMGISLLLFFAQLFGGQGSFIQIAIAHVTFCISYVAIIVRARAIDMDPRLEEAGRDLGASAWGAFRFVTLPALAPAIAAGGMIAFALSFDDLVITSFNAGVGNSTLPLYIYSKIRFGVTPEINAVSTIIVAVTAIAILIAWRLGAFSGEERRFVAEETGPLVASAEPITA
jgi:spermidine/putrescine transport system permease protein